MVAGSLIGNENSQWTINSINNRIPDPNASTLPDRSEVRFANSIVRGNLHSHIDRPAPVTAAEQEVTLFGSADANDDWKIKTLDGSDCGFGSFIRLQHVATGKLLSSKLTSHQDLTAGFAEITCIDDEKSPSTIWLVQPPQFDLPIPKNFDSLIKSIEDRLAKAQTANNHADAVLETARTQTGELLKKMEHDSAILEGTLDRLTSEIEALRQQGEAQKARLDKNIAEYQQQFSQAEQSRRQHYDEIINLQTAEFEKMYAEKIDDMKSLQDELSRKADQHLAQIQKSQEDASKIVRIIGNIGVTGNFQRIADIEEKAADLFRWIAIACMGLMLVVILFILYNVHQANFSWQIASFRAVIALAFGIPAWYCGSESARHRAVADRNRRIELELASIHPYLDKLPTLKSQEIIEKLAPQYFGQKADTDDNSVLTKFKAMKAEEVLTLIERISKLIKPT